MGRDSHEPHIDWEAGYVTEGSHFPHACQQSDTSDEAVGVSVIVRWSISPSKQASSRNGPECDDRFESIQSNLGSGEATSAAADEIVLRGYADESEKSGKARRRADNVPLWRRVWNWKAWLGKLVFP